MNTTIWKFKLKPNEAGQLVTTVEMPVGAELLSAREAGDDLVYVWALVDPNAQVEPRMIATIPTGKEITGVPPLKKFLGTVFPTDNLTAGGSGLVFHIFEV